jgi:hypothetical protein
VYKSPGTSLRIFLLKEREEFGISEVLQAGSIVSHSILVAWEVEGVVVVAVLSLVDASEVAEHGRDTIG